MTPAPLCRCWDPSSFSHSVGTDWREPVSEQAAQVHPRHSLPLPLHIRRQERGGVRTRAPSFCMCFERNRRFYLGYCARSLIGISCDFSTQILRHRMVEQDEGAGVPTDHHQGRTVLPELREGIRSHGRECRCFIHVKNVNCSGCNSPV